MDIDSSGSRVADLAAVVLDIRRRRESRRAPVTGSRWWSLLEPALLRRERAFVDARRRREGAWVRERRQE
jgi:hypothetical protein